MLLTLQRLFKVLYPVYFPDKAMVRNSIVGEALLLLHSGLLAGPLHHHCSQHQ